MSRRMLPLFLLAPLAACAAAPRTIPATDMVTIESRPIPLNPDNPARVELGKLRYMGGLWLQSADPRFGGLSGMRWHGGKLYAVSDAGDWFVIDIREDGGWLTGAGPARIRHLARLDGRPLPDKIAGDAEALNLNFGDCPTDGCEPESASIAFERDHRVWTYRVENGLPQGRPQVMGAPPAWLKRLPANGGVEAVAGVDGLWLMAAEQLRTADGRASVLVLHNGGKGDAGADRWQEIGLPLPDGFSPTDADHLDGASFLMLFRRYSLMAGVAARVERVTVDLADGQPRITTVPIAELRPPMNVDNMEGLAVRHEGGRIFVYLVSDDNFSGAQRTLLMKFELAPE